MSPKALWSLLLCPLLQLATCSLWAAGSLPLRNAQTALTFAQTDKGFVVAELKCLRPARSFLTDGPAGPMWRLALRPQSYDAAAEVVLDSTAPCHLEGATRGSGAGQCVELRWLGVDLPGESAALDVTVTVDLRPGAALSEWRIRVANRSRKLGLWTVDFPLLPDLTASKRGVLAVPLGWGTLQTDPVRTGSYTAEYPSLFATMQVTSLADRGACLYVSSHDPDGYVKRISWNARPDRGRVEYFLRGYPEDMGKPGKDYASPYPVVIGCLRGDWLNAAKRYRQWVMAEAPWAPKEPLERNQGTPEWLKHTALWLQSNGTGSAAPTDSLLNCLDVRAAMPDVAIANQPYWWQQGWPGQAQFDEGYPDTFFNLGRGKDEMATLKRLRDAGIRMAPYTNPNLVEARTEYWKKGGWRWAALPAEQAGRKQAWLDDINRQAAAGKVVNVAMCPYAPERGDVVVEWAKKIVGEWSFDGVYLDQVGCINATMCFDPSHGHPLGGGKHWVQGYRRLLGRVQRAIRAINPDAILTTESACEPFGHFDAYLRCNEDQGWMTPIWSAVYGGLTQSYGSYLYGEDNLGGCKWAAKFAQLYTYGAQLGWLGAGPGVGEASPSLGYLHELARARTVAARWIAMGEYMRPPRVTGAEQVTGRWKLFASEYDVTWPAVLSAAFQAADGTVAITFTNYSTKPQQFNWQSRQTDLGLTSGKCEISTLYPPTSPTPAAQQTGQRLSGSLRMEPLSVIVLQVKPR